MKVLLCCVVFSFFISCGGNKKPDDILPEAKMQAVLWDMMRADEYLINYVHKDSGYNKDEKSLELYSQIYRIHKTNQAQVKKSLYYYNREQSRFKVMLDSLEKRKTHLMEEQYKKVSADSSKKRIRLNDPK